MSHAVEGEKTARKILKENRLLDENILLTVLHHDEFEYKPDKSNVELKIIFGSVYDIDKLRYGTEREKDFWLMEQRKGIAPEEAIHDYNFLFPILDSWHTHFGKKVCRQYLVYALEISKYIESKFS